MSKKVIDFSEKKINKNFEQKRREKMKKVISLFVVLMLMAYCHHRIRAGEGRVV